MILTWHQPPATDIATIWDSVAGNGVGVTYFHTRIWAETIERCFPRWVAKPLVLEFSDQNIMVMPMMRRRGLIAPFRYSESMIPGVYGGPIFLSPPSAAHWDITWNAIKYLSDINIVGNPYLSYQGMPGKICRPMFTQAIALDQGFYAVKKAFRKGHRANIKSAQKQGVEVRLATSRHEVDAYFQIYAGSLQRWGKAASGFYPARLFHDLFEQSSASQPIDLWLTYLGERIIGGALVLCHQNRAIYWHGAYQSEFFECHPAHLTISTALAAYCERGYSWFDFNPSGGLAGVEQFKAGFGPQTLDFSYYRSTTPFGKAFRLYRHTIERSLRRYSL